jgi:hypothetical protein
VKRGSAFLAVAALLATGCGGGGTSSPTTPSTPSPGGSSKLVVLESGNFDALVLAPGRVALVKFQSPT